MIAVYSNQVLTSNQMLTSHYTNHLIIVLTGSIPKLLQKDNCIYTAKGVLNVHRFNIEHVKRNLIVHELMIQGRINADDGCGEEA